MWLKIWTNYPSKTLIIASIYKHPSEHANKFIDNCPKCLKKLPDEKKIFYILGDININISNST